MTEFTSQRPTANRNQDWWDKFWKDDSGRVVIWQNPSPLLYGWVVLTLISLFTNGTVAGIFWWIAVGVLVIWALLELFKGVNYLRRLLGLVVLLLTIGAIFKVGY